MLEKINPSVEYIRNHPRYLYLVAILPLLTLIKDVKTAIQNQDIASIILLLVVFGLYYSYIAFLQYYYLPRPHQISRRYFKPFEHLDKETVCPREDTIKLRDKIENSKTKNNGEKINEEQKSKPIIIVGDTGVGKSTLVNDLVLPIYKDKGWEDLIVTNYAGFENEIISKLTKLFPHWQFLPNGTLNFFDSNQKSLLVIFDQFEQFLAAASRDSLKYDESMSWLKNFIGSLLQSEYNNRVLIILRKEFYFDLKFLQDITPPPYECFPVLGFDPKTPSDGISDFGNKLRDAADNQEIVQPVIEMLKVNNRILPVEATLVGCALENKAVELGSVTPQRLKEMGDKDDIIRAFLVDALSSKPRFKSTSLQILFALSIETTYRKVLTKTEIARIIHKPEKEVEECLKSLKELSLVQSHVGNFQLRHDYLAERFHEISGSELDPNERDNILFFGDELRKGHSSTHIRLTESRPTPFKVASDYVMLLLYAAMIFRLLSPLFNVDWDWFNRYATVAKSESPLFDQFYLPVFISHMLWSTYVAVFYRRFFYFLNEGFMGRVLSYMTLFLCALSVLLALFVPYFWVFSVGIGGIGIGIKLVHVSAIKGLRPVSKRFFQLRGWATIATNTLGTTALGMLFAMRYHTNTPSPELNNEFFGFSVYILVVMLFFVYYVGTKHITRKATSMMLGMVDRMPRLRTHQVEPPPKNK